MRDINDPENPYREQYAEWDYYCYAQANAFDDEAMEGWNEHKVPLARRWIQVEVDHRGFPVPMLQSHRERMQWYRELCPESSGCTHEYEVYADVPEGLEARMYAAEQELRAQFVPPLPRWLAKNPPLKALLLPDGSFITFGDLGSGHNCTVFTDFHRRIDWDTVAAAHYSPEGDLLAQLDPGQPWCAMFWPDAEAVLNSYDENQTCWWQQYGFVIVQQLEGWKRLAIYDYHGTPLPLETDPRSHDENIWVGWFGREIVLLYEAQQRGK